MNAPARTAVLALVAALVLAAPVLAQQAPVPAAATAPSNILLTVRLGTLDAGKRTVAKTFQVVLADGPNETRLLAGSRVPLPTLTEEGVTHFTYQNIGFSITASAQLVPGDRVLLNALLEDSRVKGAPAPGSNPAPGSVPPTVETRQVQIHTVLADKTPLEVTRVEGLLDQPGFIEIEARILK